MTISIYAGIGIILLIMAIKLAIDGSIIKSTLLAGASLLSLFCAGIKMEKQHS